MSATPGGAMTGSGPLAALLDGLVDYAGLFPPASLGMVDAASRFAGYARGARRAMLGRFVVPVARLDELAAAHAGLGLSSGDAAWRLAVLADADHAGAISRFNEAHRGRLAIDTIEAKAADVETIWALASAYDESHRVFVEVPVRDDPSVLIAELSARGLGAKIRTGGTTPDAFPAPGEVLRFLAACARNGVAFKATAGLHHALRGEYPLTYEPGAAHGSMYGFLNLFMAAALLYDGVDEVELVPLLEERDARAFRIESDTISWRGRTVDTGEVTRTREAFATSFGSCSFDEPVQDLRALDLLPAD